jgi:hypothetical protein
VNCFYNLMWIIIEVALTANTVSIPKMHLIIGNYVHVLYNFEIFIWSKEFQPSALVNTIVIICPGSILFIYYYNNSWKSDWQSILHWFCYYHGSYSVLPLTTVQWGQIHLPYSWSQRKQSVQWSAFLLNKVITTIEMVAWSSMGIIILKCAARTQLTNINVALGNKCIS